MRNAFIKMFWGFLLVLIEIHIFVIDILPDPVGYYLIYVGLSSLVNKYPIGKRAANWAIALSVISIPTVFVQQAIDTFQVLSFWSIYIFILGLLKIILVFYVFQMLLEIAENQAALGLSSYTGKLFKVYVSIMLMFYIIQPFNLNFNQDMLAWFWFMVITSLVLEILFLVLLLKFRKLEEVEEYQIASSKSNLQTSQTITHIPEYYTNDGHQNNKPD